MLILGSKTKLCAIFVYVIVCEIAENDAHCY